MTQPNPYAPPNAAVEDVLVPHDLSKEPPPMWNPLAAFWWSVLFSPIFGALLHKKNWEALGKQKEATASGKWVVWTIATMVIVTVLVAVFPENAWLDRATNSLGIILVVSWYTAVGRSQRLYVQENFGKNYPRRGWLVPISFAILTLIGIVAVLLVVAMLLGIE